MSDELAANGGGVTPAGAENAKQGLDESRAPDAPDQKRRDTPHADGDTIAELGDEVGGPA